MRISKEYQDLFKETIHKIDPDALVYLFGSRLYDNAKGGDIDLLVISQIIKLKNILEIKRIIFDSIEEEKIDITLSKKDKNPFVNYVLDNAIAL